MSQVWGSHQDVGRSEQTGHLVGLQSRWSTAYLLVEGPDSGDVVANTPHRQKLVGEVGDVQACGGDVWIKEVESVVIAELYEGLCLQGVVSGSTGVESMLGNALSSLLQLRE